MSSSSTRTSTTAHSSGSRSSFSSIASTTTTSTTSDSPFFVTTFTNAPSQTAAPVGTSTISGTGKIILIAFLALAGVFAIVMLMSYRVRHLKRHDRPISEFFIRHPSTHAPLGQRQPIPRTHGFSLADIQSFQWARRAARDEQQMKDAPLPLYDPQRPPDYVELDQQGEGSGSGPVMATSSPHMTTRPDP